MKYYVRDNGSTLEFDGVLLAEASSRDSRPRWVEFKLYRAATGQYVIERIGRSIQFHRYECKTVERNGINAVDYDSVPSTSIPCPMCRPSRIDPEGLFPERDRPWFQTCDTAAGVVKTLTRVDENGSRYLTNVVKDLLGDASRLDDGIYQNYVTQTLG